MAQEVADEQFTIAQCELRIREIYASALPHSHGNYPPMSLQRKQLCVAIVRDQRELAWLEQWRPDFAGQELLYVDASGQAEVAERLAQSAVPGLSQAEMPWSDVLELLQRLMAEQGYSALSIFPAAKMLAGVQADLLSTNDSAGSSWGKLLRSAGVQHHSLTQDSWVLQGKTLADWLAAKHVTLGVHVFSLGLHRR